MIHQPLGGVQGTGDRDRDPCEKILRLREELNGILAKHSEQSLETIKNETERDNFMTAQMAKDYGLIDHILTRNELAKVTQK